MYIVHRTNILRDTNTLRLRLRLGLALIPDISRNHKNLIEMIREGGTHLMLGVPSSL
jgi:hypothetical protein